MGSHIISIHAYCLKRPGVNTDSNCQTPWNIFSLHSFDAGCNFELFACLVRFNWDVNNALVYQLAQVGEDIYISGKSGEDLGTCLGGIGRSITILWSRRRAKQWTAENRWKCPDKVNSCIRIWIEMKRESIAVQAITCQLHSTCQFFDRSQFFIEFWNPVLTMLSGYVAQLVHKVTHFEMGAWAEKCWVFDVLF